MSVKCQTIMNLIEEYAPKILAEDWDNVGLQIGDPAGEVNKVLITLDVTLDVVNEAIAGGFDLIVSHHPLIFNPIKYIRFDLPLGKMISLLMANKIALYAAHTNLDSAEKGVNAVLTSKFNLINTKVLDTSYTEEGKVSGLGRIGYLKEPISLRQLVAKIKAELNIDYVRVVGNLDKEIKKLALCGGAGASLMSKAAFAGADAYLTGDIKYHEAQDALAMGLSIIDAGHYATEQHIVPVLVDYLQEKAQELKLNIIVVTANNQQNPLVTL